MRGGLPLVLGREIMGPMNDDALQPERTNV